MPISFMGKTRLEVEARVIDFLEHFEKNGSYDYVLDVRQVGKGMGWKGTLMLFFHNS